MSAKRATPTADFRKILDRISRAHDTRKVFNAFTRFAACALAYQTREPDYLEEAKRWKPDEMALFAEAFAALVTEMEAHPFEDRIGTHYMEWALSTASAQRGGEFHTPPAVCKLMAQITWNNGADMPKEGPITVCEPACGAGAMILALGECVPPDVRRRLRITAIDVNRTAGERAGKNCCFTRQRFGNKSTALRPEAKRRILTMRNRDIGSAFAPPF